MKNTVAIAITIIVAFVGGYLLLGGLDNNVAKTTEEFERDSLTTIIKTEDMSEKMKLGAFSISLSVKDLKVSKAFYEKMGFVANGGSLESNYLIMKNENALIGLFQGMFDGNILTFNPGWNENAENIETFDDVRSIQKDLQNNGVELMTTASDSTEGPASIMLTDPDGNLILIDQHR
jgi:predicted lactoylglutathione lyase